MVVVFGTRMPRILWINGDFYFRFWLIFTDCPSPDSSDYPFVPVFGAKDINV
jgi:hypothetical protein